LQLCELATMCVVLASKFGLDLLLNSKYVVVDGTHGTCEQKMTLTTMLGFKKGVAIPCAYFLSKAKDTETYECFYEVFSFFYFSLFNLLILFQYIGNQEKN